MTEDTIASLQETLRRERGLMAQRRAFWREERERLEARIAEQEKTLAVGDKLAVEHRRLLDEKARWLDENARLTAVIALHGQSMEESNE